MTPKDPVKLVQATEKTLSNAAALAAAYLREKDGEVGAFEKAYNETVGKSPEDGSEVEKAEE